MCTMLSSMPVYLVIKAPLKYAKLRGHETVRLGVTFIPDSCSNETGVEFYILVILVINW
jgi:hypothetical protein